MALGWSLVIKRLFSVACFRFARLMCIVVQRIYWELNGTGRRLRQSTDPRYYERSAQVLDVVGQHRFCEMQANSIKDFICFHNRFENPQYIIDNEHVTLLTLTDSSAVFAVAKGKDMRLWKTEFNSFIRLAQPIFCGQLIVVPLVVFHRMAETIGDPKGELVFVFNTARCGSTLLTQIMEYTGRCVSLSEPNTPNLIATKYRKEGNTPVVRELGRDVIRWECRPYPSMQPPPLAYVLKITAPSAVALPLFFDLYPESRNLFMYREVVKGSKSLFRVAYTLPSIWIAYKLGRISGAITASAIESMGLDGNDYRVRLRDDMDLGFILNCLLMRIYLDLRKDGKVDVVGVRYEDLVEDPKESIRRIIEFCGLPADLVEPGVKGLDVDSQRNSVIAKSIIGSLPEPKLTPESIARGNEMLKKNGLPLIGEEFVLDGTITYQK